MVFRSSLSFSVYFHLLLLAILWFAMSEHLTQDKRVAANRRDWTMVQVVPPSVVKNRIVQTAPGQKTKEPPKDAYLGKETQVVSRQTVSRGQSTDIQVPAQKRRAQAKTKDTAVAKNSLERFAVPILPKHREPAQVAEENPLTQEYGKSAHEYVPGIKESDRTALNTKEFVFYSYYQRIRERLDRAWIPLLKNQVAKIYKKGRQLASEFDYTTRVLVTMNGSGEIVKISVLNESGTKDLDDAAVGAFNQAGPFPNPPSGLVDSLGHVEIPWEFILRT